MLWGKPHRTCPLKIFEKNYKFENRKILNFNFCQKNCSDRPNFISGERKTVFRPKNQFQKFSIFGLRKFSKIFQNLGKNFEIFDQFFVKSCNSFPVLKVAYHLQLIGVPNGFYRTSLTLLVQEKIYTKNGQKLNFFDKNFSKISFLSGFHEKSSLVNPHYFLTPNNSYHWQHRSKVNHFGEKVKNHQKLSKIMKFFKNLTFITPDLTGCPNVPTSA